MAMFSHNSRSYLTVTGEVSLQTNCSLLTEVLEEHVTGTTSNTFWVSQFVRFCLSENVHVILGSSYKNLKIILVLEFSL